MAEENSSLGGRPSILHAGLLDFHRPDAGENGPPWQMAVANDLAPAGFAPQLVAVVEVGGDLSLNGLGEHLPGSRSAYLGKDVRAGGQWQTLGNRGSLTHGSVLLCLVGIRVG